MRTKAALQSCGRTASANGICSLNRQLRRAGAPASIETSFVAKQQPTIAAAAGIQQHESIAPCRGLCAPCAALADVRRRCRIDAGNVRAAGPEHAKPRRSAQRAAQAASESEEGKRHCAPKTNSYMYTVARARWGVRHRLGIAGARARPGWGPPRASPAPGRPRGGFDRNTDPSHAHGSITDPVDPWLCLGPRGVPSR